MKEKHGESMKRIEGKISDLSQQILSGTYEMGNRDAIELRNRTIPSVPSIHKQIIEKEQWASWGTKIQTNKKWGL